MILWQRHSRTLVGSPGFRDRLERSDSELQPAFVKSSVSLGRAPVRVASSCTSTYLLPPTHPKNPLVQHHLPPLPPSAHPPLRATLGMGRLGKYGYGVRRCMSPSSPVEPRLSMHDTFVYIFSFLPFYSSIRSRYYFPLSS